MKHSFLLLCICLLLGSCSQEPEILRVVSYNIKNDYDKSPPNNWSARKLAMSEQIKEINPDVLGLQEALLNQIEDLQKALPAYSWVGMGRDGDPTSGEFCAIFYKKEKFTKLNSNTYWLGEQPSKPHLSYDAAYPRIVTALELQSPNGAKTYILNTHFDHIGETARLKAAEQIAANSQPYENTILMGDFNATKDSPPIQELLKTFQDSRTAALPEISGEETTFNGFTKDPIDYRIDFILFKGSKLKAVKQAHIQKKKSDGNYISDHFPIYADFQLN